VTDGQTDGRTNGRHAELLYQYRACLLTRDKNGVAIVIKTQIDDGIRIMLLNLPGGSTLQWAARRGLLCLAPLVIMLLYILYNLLYIYILVTIQLSFGN